MAEQKGQLVWKGKKYGWYGRYYITDPYGKRRRVCRALHENGKPIFDKTRAQWKLDQLIAQNTDDKAESERGETYRETAERVHARQEAGGLAGISDRRRRQTKHVYPLVGDMDPRAITKATVLEVLRSVRDKGKSRSEMQHVLSDISGVLQDLFDAEILTRNVARTIDKKKDFPQALHEVTRRSKKVRAVLTDGELADYLTWEHPEPGHRLAVFERQIMSCIARVLGGLRTGDLHGIRWESFGAPEFEQASVERQKRSNMEDGGEIQEFEIPAMLRPYIKLWWEQSGSPSEGLIFPKLRGDDAGEGQREHTSHAHAFRRDLRRMWGIDRAVEVQAVRSNGRGLTIRKWEPDVRPMTTREREVFAGKDHPKFKPVDFHSWRRATAQALKRGGVNAQTAKAVLNHKNLETTDLYLRSGDVTTIPVASLPRALPDRVGHKELGTIDEQPRPAVTNGARAPLIPWGYSPPVAASPFWVPAVGGSNPLTPTLFL